MERLLIGLPDYRISRVISVTPTILEVCLDKQVCCPHCGSYSLRTKDSFWRYLRNVAVQGQSSLLQIRCHKYRCNSCGCYFNTRLPGVKRWGRSTELLKRDVYRCYNNGYSNKDIAYENGISVASVERYYHQVINTKNSHLKSYTWPRVLGIDEHRFTRKQGFLTTFCNLERHKVFDVAQGRSLPDLAPFICQIEGREHVKVVCIDMNSSYRHLIRKWFPKAKIVSDRFHVIRLVNHHFMKVCKLIDEATLAYGRFGLMRLMQKKRERLTEKQQNKLERYFEGQPAIAAIYSFCHDLNDLLRVKSQTRRSCRKYVKQLLDAIAQLKASNFAPMKTLGRTLYSWREEIACMFRFTRNNGITEGFHRKMKLIQRRAYGFRNFENYRLRVKVLCC